MKLGMMQPYFFPSVGYFSLIKACDYWIAFDDVQFIRHGWIERNRVLNSDGQWQYIKIPLVKASRNTKIKNIKIKKNLGWKEKIFAQLVCYKRKAPFYSSVMKFISDALKKDFDNITYQNIHVLNMLCEFLEIPFEHGIFSKLNLGVNENVKHSGDWAYLTAVEIGATEYINNISGKALFVKDDFKRSSIKLTFIESKVVEYQQKNDAFIPRLSIIDAMMFNSKEEVTRLINNFTLI